MLKHLEGKKDMVGKFKQILATICLGPLIIGVSVSWTSPVLPQLQSNATTFHLTTGEASMVATMLGLGVLASAIPVGYITRRFGIKKLVIGQIVPLSLFTILVIVADNVHTLYVARFFLGIANGAVCVLSPMYISEISDSKFRGTLGSFFEFLIYVAVVFVAICGAYVSYTTLTITIGVICCALSITFIFLPESPCHLLKMDKTNEAQKAIMFYRSKNSNVEDALKEIYDTIETQRHQKSLKEALRSRCVVRGLIASVGLTLFQKFSGIDSIIFYTVNIFQETEAGLNAYTSSIIVTSVQLISATINVFVAESANRRTFLYISTIGMGLSLTGLATFFVLKDNDMHFTGFGYMPLVSLVIYAFSFSMGLGPILWMLYGELFAPDVKGLANGITMSTNWGFLTVVTNCFPIMVVNIGPHYTFYLFSLCMFACSVFIKFCVPETKGKTLDQIQIELSS